MHLADIRNLRAATQAWRSWAQRTAALAIAAEEQTHISLDTFPPKVIATVPGRHF